MDAAVAAVVAVTEKCVATCPEIPATDALGGWSAAVQVGAASVRGRRGRRPPRDEVEIEVVVDADVDELFEKVRKLEDCNARLVRTLHAREEEIERQAALLGRLSGRDGDEKESVVVLRDAAGNVVFRDADLRDGEERVLHVVRTGDVLEYTVGDSPQRFATPAPTKNVKLQCGRSFFFLPNLIAPAQTPAKAS